EEIKHLKSEKELNETKQSEEIFKINNNSLILKQQLVYFILLFQFQDINKSSITINQDNQFAEIEQLKKEIKSKDNQFHQINISHDEDKKENNSNHQLLQTKFNIPFTPNFDLFPSSSKLINTFTGHTNTVCSIDYSAFNDCQFICSGSADRTVRVWDVDNNKLIQSFNGHSSSVCCVKFSSYHYYNHRQTV
ncbi:peptidase C14, caspase catalytic subunit p20, partial [Reticulomyxa filosa]